MDNEDLYSADVPQRKSPLNRLPQEVLLNVAQHLDTEDFCALRLTSVYTSSLLRPLLARRTFAGVPWRDSAARLDALSRYPDCAQQIRAVRIRSRAVYEDEEQIAWADPPGELKPALWPLKKASSTARKLACFPEMKTIRPLKADLLTEALCRLRRLEELELSWERFPFMSRADMGLDVELGVCGGDDDDGGYADSELAEQLEYTTGGWQVEMLVDLASDMAPLRSLTVTPLALEAMDQASYLPLVTNLFNSLTRLDLQVTAAAQRSDPSLLSKLEDVLEGAWVLRHLRLDFDSGGFVGAPGEDDRSRARHFAREFLPKTHLAHLITLRLVRGAAKIGDIAELLRRHAGTLRELELRDMRGVLPSAYNLVDGGDVDVAGLLTWDDFFRTLPALVPRLARATVRGYTADHARAVVLRVAGERLPTAHGEDERDVLRENDLRRGAGSNGEGSSGRGSKRGWPDGTPTVDPKALEAYIVGGGEGEKEFPLLPWEDIDG